MGRAGSALDNAVIESWHSSVEFELRQLERFATQDQARRRVATWMFVDSKPSATESP